MREPRWPEDGGGAGYGSRVYRRGQMHVGFYLRSADHTDVVHVAHSTAQPLTEEEQALKEQYAEAGFHGWSRRDFQQFVVTSYARWRNRRLLAARLRVDFHNRMNQPQK